MDLGTNEKAQETGQGVIIALARKYLAIRQVSKILVAFHSYTGSAVAYPLLKREDTGSNPPIVVFFSHFLIDFYYFLDVLERSNSVRDRHRNE